MRNKYLTESLPDKYLFPPDYDMYSISHYAEKENKNGRFRELC